MLGSSAILSKSKTPLALASSTGTFKLAPMRRDGGSNTTKAHTGINDSPSTENATVWKLASETASKEATPEPKSNEQVPPQAADVGKPHIINSTGSSQKEHSTNDSNHDRKMMELSEDEFEKLGIQVAHHIDESEAANRSFNWDDDDDNVDESEWAKLEEQLPAGHTSQTSVRSASSLKKGKDSAVESGPKLAPWSNVSADKDDFVPIDKQIKELSDRKKREEEQRRQRAMRQNSRHSHGFHGHRGGFGDRFDDRWDDFGHRDISPPHRFDDGSGDSRYRFNDYERRYRDREGPGDSFYGRRQPDFFGDRQDRGFGRPRRYSRDENFGDMPPHFGKDEPPFMERRPSIDDNWRRNARPLSPARLESSGRFENAVVPPPSRRRPSVASSDSSRTAGLKNQPAQNQPSIEKEPEHKPAVDLIALKERQKEEMRIKLEAAKKRKEEERKQEEARLEAARAKANALAKKIEEQQKKEQQEKKRLEEERIARIAEEKRIQQEQKAKEKPKYVLPSRRLSSSGSRAERTLALGMPKSQRGRAESNVSSVSIEDTNTIRAVDQLVSVEDKDSTLLKNENKAGIVSGIPSKKQIWNSSHDGQNSSADTRISSNGVKGGSRLWEKPAIAVSGVWGESGRPVGTNSVKTGESAVTGSEQRAGTGIGAKTEAEEAKNAENPWDGNWRAHRAELHQQRKNGSGGRGHSRFFPMPETASAHIYKSAGGHEHPQHGVSGENQGNNYGNPRVVLPQTNQEQEANHGGPINDGHIRQNQIGPAILHSPTVISKRETGSGLSQFELAQQQRMGATISGKPRISVPGVETGKEFIPMGKVTVTSRSYSRHDQEGGNGLRKKEVLIKLPKEAADKETLAPVIKGQELLVRVPGKKFGSSAYIEDFTGYVHRREYEQAWNTPLSVMVRIPGLSGKEGSRKLEAGSRAVGSRSRW